MPLALHLLAVAVFAMGTSEFMLAGLLPGIAADLGVSAGTAGLLTSGFAVGMVVGAPLMAALARNRPGRSSLLVFVLVFLAAHVVGALTGDFAVLLATRVVAALANAGFLAVAVSTAAGLVPPDAKGRALSVLLGGTTVATVAGVPGGALLGALLGWRATFWAVALLCLPAALGVLRGIPAPRPGGAAAPDLRRELAELRRPRLLLMMLLGALVNAATFGTLTFFALVVTGPAALGPLWVSVALVLFGLGSFAGVTAAGRLSDRRPGLVLAAGGPLLLLGWITLATSAGEPYALLPLAFVQGALSFAVGSTLITRVLYESPGAPAMSGSYATAALNLGAVAGPLVAAPTLGTGLAAVGPVWTSAALTAAALLLTALSARVFTGKAAPRPAPN
ncbi:Cmx/CmrA family chloramphenicol efflux MFS transporter [Bailinhaonella thermotolerans]|uniref:MFS transporter n=1 Tax=Bailinhaonella thermotolerans TaxID=1070861 RepID=A0A3A4ANU4_9ACTN|nr:Cmx/CmrA family chloramphenicol efflux MFS transporter [Bailinhaonella thermotolerans]RJL30135.1 MFS transporter [Bailinhaonella thermotolerans]